MSEASRVVVVGAGAVGAVYGHHLQRGGAHLTFLVRPRYAESVRAGIRLWRAARRGEREERLVPDDVVSDVDALRDRAVDQMWLAVPTTGLDEDALARIGAATAHALVVDLSPDVDGHVVRAVGRERVVDGLIPFIAYQSPLPDVAEEAGRAPGIAWWLPPFAPTALSGPRARDAASLLAAGRMPVRVVKEVQVSRALGGALLQAVVATLEVSGWSLRTCRARLDGAAGEAVAAMARRFRVRALPFSLLASPIVLRTLLWLAPRVTPLPLEAYLKFHFTKVGAQSRVALRSFLAAADDAGLAAPHLRRLARELPAAPAAPH